jgi:hypothetical protein
MRKTTPGFSKKEGEPVVHITGKHARDERQQLRQRAPYAAARERSPPYGGVLDSIDEAKAAFRAAGRAQR